jgi:hypothetical protein
MLDFPFVIAAVSDREEVLKTFDNDPIGYKSKVNV